MSISINGYHGYLYPADVKKLDLIASPKRERVEWEFRGDINKFAELWKSKFMCVFDHSNQTWIIYVTSKSSFGQY